MKVFYYLVRGTDSLRKSEKGVKTPKRVENLACSVFETLSPAVKKRIKDKVREDHLFVEHVELRKESWPMLIKAIEKAKSLRQPLQILNVGKLTRSPSFLRVLTDSRVEFDTDCVLCDKNVAQHYAFAVEWVRNLSSTMRDAMSGSKAKMGFAKAHHRNDRRCVAGALKGSANAAKARTERSRRAYAAVVAKIEIMRSQEKTWDEIAEQLNRDGHRSTSGLPFNRPTLIRLYQRARGVKPRKRNET
jgi:hypothetical protein